jgi:glycogen synthase
LRLFAALGPGNIVAAQRRQLAGESSQIAETCIVFSGQLYEYCRQRGIEALFTSDNGSADRLVAPPVTLINIPRAWETGSGWKFHVSRILYAIRLARIARKFRADFALIDSGTTHYFALVVFWLMRIPVAVNFHNVRWPQGFQPSGLVGRSIRLLDSWFFRRVAAGAVGCSPECGLQAQADGANKLPYFGWCSQFRTVGFSPNDNANSERNPFRLIFVGRLERSKGVFDLLRIADVLKLICKVPVIIEVCGTGSALAELQRAVDLTGNGDRLIVRGRLERAELLKTYSRAHAVIVPTRGDFAEGMPLVCAEAVLAGRPIVTSRLSNALPLLGETIAEAEPENIESYARVICKLAEDEQYYESLRAACDAASQQFLDREKSYPAAVDRLITQVRPGRKPFEGFHRLFDTL